MSGSLRPKCSGADTVESSFVPTIAPRALRSSHLAPRTGAWECPPCAVTSRGAGSAEINSVTSFRNPSRGRSCGFHYLASGYDRKRHGFGDVDTGGGELGAQGLHVGVDAGLRAGVARHQRERLESDARAKRLQVRRRRTRAGAGGGRGGRRPTPELCLQRVQGGDQNA